MSDSLASNSQSSAVLLKASIENRERWERDRQVVLAQLHNMMLALRSNAKFSSRQRYAVPGRDGEHRLTKAVRDLREALFSPASQRELSGDQLLAPFISVAVSEETTEPITGVALAAFVAFLELKCSFLTAESLMHMCDAARKSRSEVTDAQSHEAVLARILQVFVGCVRHPAAISVSQEHIVSMLESAYAIASQGDPSELLRRTAEQAMNDIVAAVYERVVSDNGPCNPSVLRYVTKLIMCDGSAINAARHPDGTPAAQAAPLDSVFVAAVQLQGLCLAHTILFILKDALRYERCTPLMECVRNDLCRSLLKVGGHVENIVVLSQLLRTAHLVVQFASTEVVPQTLTLIQGVHLNPVSRRLAQEEQQIKAKSSPTTSTPMSPAGKATRQFSHMDEEDIREQHEMLMESLLEFCSDHAFPSFVFYHYDLSTRYPNLLEELCQFLSRNCFHASPQGPTHSPTTNSPVLNQLNMLSLDCLMAMLSSVGERVVAYFADCKERIATMKPVIEERAAKKQKLLQFAAKFAEDPPKRAIKWLREPENGECFGIKADCSGWDLGEFLFHHKSLLEKTNLGNYIGDLGKEPQKPTAEEDPDGTKGQEWEDARYDDYKKFDTVRFYAAQLKGFMNCFDFKGKPLLQCVREMVYEMRLPGEAQKIDRVMEAFAIHWYSSNKDEGETINPFSSDEAAFILSFSIIMLNTDLHSGKLDNTMTMDGFKSMNRGIDKGNSIPDAYLEATYTGVKSQQIIMIDMIEQGFDYDASWAVEVHESEEDSKECGMIAGMRGCENEDLVALDEETFQVLWRPCIAAFSTILDACGNSLTIGTHVTHIDELAKVFPRESVILQCSLRGFELCAKTAFVLGNAAALDHVAISLLKLVSLRLRDGYNHLVAVGKSAKALLAAQLLFRIIKESGGEMREAWQDVADMIHKLYLLGVFCPSLTAVEGEPASPVRQPDVTVTHAPEQIPGTPVVPSQEQQKPISEMLFRNPGIVHLSRSRTGGNEGGWLSGWFSSNEAAEAKRQERQREEASSLKRFQSICPTMEEFMAMCSALPDAAFTQLFVGLVNAGSFKSDTLADAFIASYNIHLVVEVAVQNITRLNLVESQLLGYIQELARSAFSHSTRATESVEGISDPEKKKQLAASAADWRQIATRVVEAILRLIDALSNKPSKHTLMFQLLSSIASLPPKSFGAIIAGPLSALLYHLIVEPHRHDVNVPAFCCRDPATWDCLLFVVHTICAAATFTEVRARGVAILASIAQYGQYDAIANSQRLARALFSAALCPPITASESESGSWLTQFDYNPVAHVASGQKPQASSQVEIAKIATDSLAQVHKRLAAGVVADDQHWVNAWHECLRALAVLSLNAPTSDGCVAALRMLQRCVLDPALLCLPSAHFLTVFNEVVFPLVESVCNASSSAPGPDGKPGRHPAAISDGSVNYFSPSSLITSMFGPVSGPEKKTSEALSQQAAATPNVDQSAYPAGLASSVPRQPSVSEELESQSALLLDKAFLHFFRPLAGLKDEFVPLWSRILGTLYAMYTLHGTSRSTSRSASAFDNAQESIRQHVTNIIMVITTPEEQPLLEAHPSFWAATRQGLRAFDFSEGLLRHLDSCSFARPQQ